MPIEQILLIASVLLLLAVMASKLSSWLGVPGLLLFLVLGMLAGSEGPGGIPFDDAQVAQALGVVALAYILFSGGLETDRTTARAVLAQGVSLATLGVLVTALAVGACARAVLGLEWLEAVLLGSIVSSTDAAAVFSVLRSKSISLKGNLKGLLELESASNDPMAIFLTVALIGLIMNPGTSVWGLIPMFFLQMTVGAVVGYGAGRGTIAALNRLRLDAEGLYPVLTLASVPLTYAVAALLQGSGFLAVYIAGIVVARGDFIQKRTILRFHDGIAWLMQIAMFLVLGLLVFPSRLAPVALAGLLLAAFLMFVARPAGVFLALAFSKMGTRQKTLISWVGLRGAAPIILSTFPLLARVPRAELYFNVVFFVVLTSVLLQGTTIPLVARWLKLEAPLSPRKEYPLEFVPTVKSRSEMIEVAIGPESRAAGRQIVDLHLPRTSLVVLVARDDDFIAPRGGTVVRNGDVLLVLTDKEEAAAVRAILDGGRSPQRQPPSGPYNEVK
ncbi:MAG TPA: potassium/proton antiporter [Bryobacteraceae bacterium]|nr:potassium/proton antiporter [Bryobacteraceae bacterium]